MVRPAANKEAPEIKKLVGVGVVKQPLKSVTNKLYDPTHKFVSVSIETLLDSNTDGFKSKV